MKLLAQFLLLLTLFTLSWYGLSKVDWVTLMNLESANKKTEQKLGDILWDTYSKQSKEVHDKMVYRAVDSLVNHICIHNNINRKHIKLHILQTADVNAFALPNGHLVVLTGLIEESANEAELCGVLGHEIAHIQKNHVMKKLGKELGLSVLLSITTGGAGGEVIKEALKLLTSTAYDRNLEREADMTSVLYLMNANVDPSPFADFLYRLSETTDEIPDAFYWISTHPESKERAEAILEYLKDKEYETKNILSENTWNKLLERVEELNE